MEHGLGGTAGAPVAASGGVRRLLHVEDSPTHVALVTAYVAPPSARSAITYEMESASSLAAALERLARPPAIDVILLDLVLPDAEGLDGLGRVVDAAPAIPVVVLTGADEDEDLGAAAVARGAQDFVGKADLTPSMLRRILRYAVDRQRMVQQLEEQATTDPLTGLLNRRGFFAAAEQHLALADRVGGPVAVLYADIDDLKPVNDELGHAAGDELILAAADVLRRVTRAADVVARVGGDEFCVVLVGATDADALHDRLDRALALANRHRDRPLSLTAGMASGTPPLDLQDLLRRADADLYTRKRERKAGGSGGG